MMFRTTLCLALMLVATSQVIGIDFGTEFWKSAIISPGKSFVIVENSKSERKTSNAIAFIDGIRLFESEAASKKGRFPKNTFTDLNTLIPLLDNPDHKVDFDIPYKFEKGTIVFQLPDDQSATIEQVIAMILKNIKEHASKQAGTEIRDCVLTVPPDWGLAARTALINAAYIADLAILSVMNDNTAAALNYAMARNDNESINVMIYNLGSHKLQVSIIRFFGYNNTESNKTIESIDVLAHTTGTEFGGYEMDNRIADILAKKFKAKTGVDVVGNKRAWAKLLQKSSDVKETLSANKEVHVYVEGLINGVDLNLVVSRAEVEELIDFSVLLKPVIQALSISQLTKDRIHSVELIGGASRIPRVVSTLSQFFSPVEVGTHINSDEAIAIGSVLHAANMSSAFRVKDIHLYDRFNFTIGVEVKDQDKTVLQQEVFFKAEDPQLLRKEIVIEDPASELTITVTQGSQELKQFKSTNLAGWKEKYDNGNLTKPAVLKIVTVLSPVAIFDIKDSFITITRNQSSTKEVVEYVKEKIVYPEEEAKGEESKAEAEEKTEEKEEEKEDKEEKLESEEKTDTEDAEKSENQQSKAETQTNQTDNSTNQTEAKKKPKRPKFKTVTVKKNVTTVEQKTIKFNVKFEVESQKYKRFTKSDISINKLLLQKFETREKLIRETAKAKNELESRLYDVRRDFEKEYMGRFGKETEIEELKKVVDQELAWLEENSYTGKKDDFVEHMKILFQAYGPIYNRTVEYQERPETFNKTVEYLGLVYEKTSELNKTHPWLRKKVQKLLQKVNETMEWYSEKLKAQESLALNEDPLVYNFEPVRRAEKLRDQYYALKLIPRPKKKQNKTEEEQAKADKAESEQTKTDKPETQEKQQSQGSEKKQQAKSEQKVEEEL